MPSVRIYDSCKSALLDVLRGDPHGLPLLSFTSNMTIQHFVIETATLIIEAVRASGELPLIKQEVRAVVFKVAAYCVRRGWQKEVHARAMMAAQADVVAAVVACRSEVGSRMNLGAMLKTRSVRARQRAIAAQEAELIPAEIAVSPCGKFRMVELKTSQQLMAEGEALNHCMRLRRAPSGRLYYFDEILEGRSRVFSLRRRGKSGKPDQPLSTIEFVVAERGVRIQPDLASLGAQANLPCLGLVARLAKIFPRDTQKERHLRERSRAEITAKAKRLARRSSCCTG